MRLAVPCEVCCPLVHQRSLRGLLELDSCRVDGFEVFVPLVVDFAEAVVEREALLGQCYFEFGVTPPPRKFWFTMFWQSVLEILMNMSFSFELLVFGF